jgi:hypothetical protein
VEYNFRKQQAAAALESGATVVATSQQHNSKNSSYLQSGAHRSSPSLLPCETSDNFHGLCLSTYSGNGAITSLRSSFLANVSDEGVAGAGTRTAKLASRIASAHVYLVQSVFNVSGGGGVVVKSAANEAAIQSGKYYTVDAEILTPAQRSEKVSFIRDVWLRGWLDAPPLLESEHLLGAAHMLKKLQPVAALKVRRLTDLGLLQLGDASWTSSAFVPPKGSTWLASPAVDSQRMLRTRQYFRERYAGTAVAGTTAAATTSARRGLSSAESQAVGISGGPVGVEPMVPPLGGGGYLEYSAFVHHGTTNNTANHQQFDVPVGAGESSAGGGPVVALSLQVVRRLLPIFTDETPIFADADPSRLNPLRRSRGALAVQLMLDQPFASQYECEKAGTALKQEFGTQLSYPPDLLLSSSGTGTSSTTRRVGVCQQAPLASPLLDAPAATKAVAGFWATGFLLEDRTVTTNALAEQVLMLATVRGYVRYMATVFVFEPQVLALGGGYLMSKTAQELAINGYRDPLVRKLRTENVEALVPTAVPLPPRPYTQTSQSDASADYAQSRQPNADVFALAGLRANLSRPNAARWIGRRTCLTGREPTGLATAAGANQGTGWKAALSRAGSCTEWDGVTAVDASVWGTQLDVAVQGSDGTQFPPQLRNGEDAVTRSRSSVEGPAMQPLTDTAMATSGTTGANGTADEQAIGSVGPSVLQVWMGEAMRPLNLDFSMRVKRYGVLLRRYKAIRLTRYENMKTNRGSIFNGGGSDNNAPINMLDLSRAHGGLPIFLGYPHFLHGVVSSIRDGVDGLNPEGGSHESLIDVEPMSGMAFNLRLRWQTTLQMAQTSVWYRDFEQPHCMYDATRAGSCSLFLPVYWVGREGSVTREQAFEFKENNYESQEIARKIAVGSFFVGSMAAAGSVVQAVQAMRLGFQAAQVAPVQMPDASDLARLMPVI